MYEKGLQIVQLCFDLFSDEDVRSRNQIIEELRNAPVDMKVEWFDRVGAAQVYSRVNQFLERGNKRTNEKGETKRSKREDRLTIKRWAQKYTCDGYTYWTLLSDTALGWASVKSLRAKADGMYYKADAIEEALRHIENGGTREEAAKIIKDQLEKKGMAPV